MPRDNQQVSPFSGFPRTIVEENCKDGVSLKHITNPRFQGPWLAKISDAVKWLSATSAAGGALYVGLQYDISYLALAASTVAAPAITFVACHFGLPHVITRSARVMFTPEHFVHLGLFKVRKYDRSLPHSFALFAHRKADREEERLSYKESKSAGRWWQGAPKRYYGNSYHIAFQFMGQRHDLMTVYRHETASKILARLKASDEAMESKVGGGRGQALKPEDEWADQSGVLIATNELGNMA